MTEKGTNIAFIFSEFQWVFFLQRILKKILSFWEESEADTQNFHPTFCCIQSQHNCFNIYVKIVYMYMYVLLGNVRRAH